MDRNGRERERERPTYERSFAVRKGEKGLQAVFLTCGAGSKLATIPLSYSVRERERGRKEETGRGRGK